MKSHTSIRIAQSGDVLHVRSPNSELIVKVSSFFVTGFEVLTLVSVRIRVFWNMMPCLFVAGTDVSKALSATIFRAREVQGVIITR
jgi:hypothetical protein